MSTRPASATQKNLSDKKRTSMANKQEAMNMEKGPAERMRRRELQMRKEGKAG